MFNLIVYKLGSMEVLTKYIEIDALFASKLITKYIERRSKFNWFDPVDLELSFCDGTVIGVVEISKNGNTKFSSRAIQDFLKEF